MCPGALGRVGHRPSVREKLPSGVHRAPWYLKQVACEVFAFYTMNIIQSASSRYPIPPWTPSAAGADRRWQKPALVDRGLGVGPGPPGLFTFQLHASQRASEAARSGSLGFRVGGPQHPCSWLFPRSGTPALSRPCPDHSRAAWEGEVQEHLQGTTEAWHSFMVSGSPFWAGLAPPVGFPQGTPL